MSTDQPSINKSNSPDSIIHPLIQQRDKNESAIRLLDSWLEKGDEKEQKETWEYLKQALDEDRLSDRKLFP